MAKPGQGSGQESDQGRRAFGTVLIANRGEIAVRIARTLRAQGLRSLAVFAPEDADSLHVRIADAALVLPGRGVQAYLDPQALLAAAREGGAQAVHPGYGFLSEDAGFARACAEAGLSFIGPSPKALALLGNKAEARALAADLAIPVLEGAGAEDAGALIASLPPGGAVMVKAVAGGGGRGLRVVRSTADLPDTVALCAAEAKAAFGSGAVYVERYLEQARHIEVQVAGDGAACIALGDRDCSLQRRNQKLVEVAPAPQLAPELRQRVRSWAENLCNHVRYRGLCTVEFLLDLASGQVFFIEANPRLQVEHTVTEAITGLDFVAAQLRLAQGWSLAEAGLEPPPEPTGAALQLRVLAETLSAEGAFKAAAGRLTRLDLPGGPGVRVDTGVQAGDLVDPTFDPLLAKIVVSAADWTGVLRRARAALAETRILGCGSNLPLLTALLDRPEIEGCALSTGWIEAHLGALAQASASDPAVEASPVVQVPPGRVAARAPMAGKVVSFEVAPGDRVRPGQTVAILDAMKMEHLVPAPGGGVVVSLLAGPGQVVAEGAPLALLEPSAEGQCADALDTPLDLDALRPDLQAVHDRWRSVRDEGRPEAVARRRERNRRTARENLDALFDPGSFIEYGAFALAAQRRRRSPEELAAMSPADGLVCGIGAVNGEAFDEDRARCMGFAYDFTVFAGTQGYQNHRKKDRLFALAEQWRLPVVFLAEGGGGRPGDTDVAQVAGLDTPSFRAWAALSGLVPRVGVTGGRCFAGNAAILGCSDVVIATRDANLGMGGPAMIEGGGLGVFAPEDIGPIADLAPAGVVDLIAEDDAHSIALARRYLAYFQGPLKSWTAPDPRRLRIAVPENRLRAYDVRRVLQDLFDNDSVLELRAAYGVGILTALARIEGRPLGVIANNPGHLGGAIDAPAAEKAARFLKLCDAFDLPVVSLCDTPGFMVGPEEERRAQVRRACSLFIAGASLSVPVFTVVLRKGYGLGAQAMAGGGFHAPFFVASWPTGEFGGMGLEGAVRLGYRRELEAIADPIARQAAFEERVARMYAQGRAESMAAVFEIDAVIDPADTRGWILRGLKSLPPRPVRERRKRTVDVW